MTLQFLTGLPLFRFVLECTVALSLDRSNFRWARGVQLRANLDCIEDWVRDTDLQELFDYMEVFANTIDLLATPKAQLMIVSPTRTAKNLRVTY